MKHVLTVFFLAPAIYVHAQGANPFQQPPATQQPAAAPAQPAAAKKDSSFLGKDVPVFDPGSEIVTWDGKSWNINNNRLFNARFEKYLNAPEETTKEDKDYREILSTILDKLAPTNLSTQSIDEAFRLLPSASNYEIDARLCDALADAIYSAWSAQQANQRLERANEALEQERKKHEWNLKMTAEDNQLDGAPPNKQMAAQWAKQQQMKRDAEVQPYATRLAEVLALIKANQLKKAVSEIQTKIEFQALILQFFLQRRFQHVLIGTRFYRAVFSDGDTQLHLNKDSKDLFEKSVGVPPTVGTLDSLANEAIRDAREGVNTFQFLLQKNELESATKRLAEAFVIGEYLPELRTLPREQKRQALDFMQKSNQLISAIDVKDYGLAEKLVHELEKTAKDFDSSKPMAAIETAKTVCDMHLAKARNAAVSGDNATLEAELKAATEIWPMNPKLKEVGGAIFAQGDVMAKAVADFDQLYGQKNYRQIFNDKARFITAIAISNDKQREKQLNKVIENVQTIEVAIVKSTEIAKTGNYAGAWESVEEAFKQFPDDSKLNQARANYTTEAADFVRTIRTAEQLEEKDQVGASLAWYLKAQKIYPASEFAREGVDRLVKKVLPET